MPVPTTDQMVTFLRSQHDMSTEGRLDDFMATFRTIAPGGFRVQDPATSPVRKGWDILEDLCRQYVGWELFVEDVKVSGKEDAIYLRNEGKHEGQPIKVWSIEHYVFGEDGSLFARYFHPLQ